jgi:glycosyltransferase involved in cell wall biosynthesis
MESLLSMRPLAIAWAQMDLRARNGELWPVGLNVHLVGRNVSSRLLAEWRLWRECRPGDVVLCFHGLPPLFPLRGRTVVFVQNRLLIEHGSLAEYPPAVRARLWVERIWSRALQVRCSRYIVQTPSMAASLQRWLRREVPISVLPFAPTALTATCDPDLAGQSFDFVYVASGEAHKNHRNLLEAWRLLAEAGHRPSLALTLDAKAFPALCEHIAQFAAAHGLAVTNLGALPGEAVDALYRAAGAMIYPSTSESFGLPLIEAAQRGLPILASELDYVRDVVEPVETFNPNSPVSIARAVRRFLGDAELPLKVGTAAAFLDEVLR